MTSPETLELEAVDNALAGRYVAPENAELAELALLLRDDRPQPDPAWTTHLDRRVEAGFPARPRKKRVWLRKAAPALAIAACLLPIMLAAAELVERRVAGDPEQPRPPASSPRLEGAPPTVGALERLGRHVLGGRSIAHQAGDIGVDVVAALPVELLERRIDVARSVGRRCRKRLRHTPTTRMGAFHHNQYRHPTKKRAPRTGHRRGVTHV